MLLPLRTRAATYLLLPGIALVVLYSFSEGNPTASHGYWIGTASAATGYTVFSCCLAALAAAIDANRARASRLRQLPVVRSALKIAIVDLWPTLVMGALIQGTGLLINATSTWGAPGRFPVELLAAWAGMILFHTALGYLVGRALPPVVARPLALLLSYVWLGFLWSLPYIPVRYLSGLAIAGCCMPYTTLDDRAVAAIVLFSVCAVLAVLGLILRRRIIVQIVAAAALLTIGVVTALATANGIAAYPVTLRPAAELNCSKGGLVDICFYPEQVWNVEPSPVTILDESVQNLAAAGISLPQRIAPPSVEGGPNTLVMVYRRDFTPAIAVHSMASAFGLYAPELSCARDAESPEAALQTSGIVTSVIYQLATDAPFDPLVTDEGIRRAATNIAALPAAQRSEWIRAAREALKDCDMPLPDQPGTS
jgi:hypothetical protein